MEQGTAAARSVPETRHLLSIMLCVCVCVLMQTTARWWKLQESSAAMLWVCECVSVLNVEC